SHGESWSIALALRLAAFRLLQHDVGTDPVLVLDDVFAELDTGRRERLAQLVSTCEQVLITAAVPDDVPTWLSGRGAILDVVEGTVTPRGQDGGADEVSDPEPAAEPVLAPEPEPFLGPEPGPVLGTDP